MARVESDREDLMAEAVALVRRIEFHCQPPNPPIIVGFRDSGWFSVYFNADLMYQFDADGRLRRAFVDGLLFRTQGKTLAQIRRERSKSETTLYRIDLDSIALAAFQRETVSRILGLANQLNSRELSIARQIPHDDSQLIDDVRCFVDSILKSPEFLAPAIAGKG